MTEVNRGYCWFLSYIYPRESQWSICHKFAAWNALGVHALHRIVASKPFSAVNLGQAKFIDPEKFFRLTGFSEVDIKRALPDCYLNQKEERLRAETLRFCPQCLSAGFHSVLHQLLLFGNCPIHHVPLRQGCPSCNSCISMEANGKNFSAAYACPSCGKEFAKVETLSLVKLNPKEAKKLEDVGRELEILASKRRNANVSWGISLRKASYKNPDHVLIYWRDLWGEGGSRKKSSASVIHSSITLSQKPATKDHSRPFEPWNTYRVIRRHFHDKIRKKHQRCLIQIQLLGSAYEGFKSSASIGCPVVHAFFLWRMYWENKLVLNDLLYDAEPRSVSWSPPEDLTASAEKCLFSIQCTTSFYALLQYSVQLNQQGRFRLLPRHEIDKWGPFVLNWCVAYPRDGSKAILHWWIAREQCFKIEEIPIPDQHNESVIRGVAHAYRLLTQKKRARKLLS